MTTNLAIEQLHSYATILKDLNDHLHKMGDWKLHPGQIKIGQKLFNENIARIFVQCGRKFGKTELCMYILWRIAMTKPGANLYYICPTFKLAKEIVWASKRLQKFGPEAYIESINNTELRVNFKNGSFIKLEGSDNVDALRGITPDGVVYDEFKDIHPEAYDSMLPNLLPKKAFMICIGTPPMVWDHYMITAEEYQKDHDCFFVEMPTTSNPHIDKAWLAKEKARLIARGDLDIWLTEYEAKFVRGGKKKIFPMLDRSKVMTFANMMREIEKDKHKLQFWSVADPGSATCFAVLFGAYNPYTKKVYFIDELYIKKQEETSTRKVWPRIDYKVKEIANPSMYGDVWSYGYDEAATWFFQEVLDTYNVFMQPTEKSKANKKDGISLLKDLLIINKAVLSDRCIDLFGEMDAYMLGPNGQYIKKDDHLIDCARYFLKFVGYSSVEAVDPSLIPAEERYDMIDEDIIYREPYLFELNNEY